MKARSGTQNLPAMRRMGKRFQTGSRCSDRKFQTGNGPAGKLLKMKYSTPGEVMVSGPL